jgi:hypothetical protein
MAPMRQFATLFRSRYGTRELPPDSPSPDVRCDHRRLIFSITSKGNAIDACDATGSINSTNKVIG